MRRPCLLISAEEGLSLERVQWHLFWKNMSTQNSVERKFTAKSAVTDRPVTHTISPRRIRKEGVARRR